MTDQPSPLIVLTLVLLAMVGPVFHAVRWLHRRKASDRQDLGRPPSPDWDSQTPARHIPPPPAALEQVSQVLRQVVIEMNETQTKQDDPRPTSAPDQTEQSLAQTLEQLVGTQTKRYAPSALNHTEQLARELEQLLNAPRPSSAQNVT